jgi:hypothetical protein
MVSVPRRPWTWPLRVAVGLCWLGMMAGLAIAETGRLPFFHPPAEGRALASMFLGATGATLVALFLMIGLALVYGAGTMRSIVPESKSIT